MVKVLLSRKPVTRITSPAGFPGTSSERSGWAVPGKIFGPSVKSGWSSKLTFGKFGYRYSTTAF